MIRFLLRKIAYGGLVLLGINLLTFVLFFQVNTPDDMARMQLGGKRVTAEAMQKAIAKSEQKPAVRSRPGIVASTPHGQAFVATQRNK